MFRHGRIFNNCDPSHLNISLVRATRVPEILSFDVTRKKLKEGAFHSASYFMESIDADMSKWAAFTLLTTITQGNKLRL